MSKRRQANPFLRATSIPVNPLFKWESGSKQPSGMALKLLAVVQKHGLGVLAQIFCGGKAAGAVMQKVHQNARREHCFLPRCHMNLSQKSDAEILSIANLLMDNLMDASTHVDYERHIRDFSDRLKAQLSRERLESICQEYQSSRGFFASREFVRLFRRPGSIAIVWQQSFTKQVGDFVAEMVLIQQGDRYLVDHVMVF